MSKELWVIINFPLLKFSTESKKNRKKKEGKKGGRKEGRKYFLDLIPVQSCHPRRMLSKWVKTAHPKLFASKNLKKHRKLCLFIEEKGTK